MKEFDLIIIGAGPAGYTGAIRAARAGQRVALLERDRVGGTCLNRGCIPTKALRQTANVLAAARETARFGVKLASDPVLDYPAAAARRDQVTATLVAGVESLLKAWKIETIKGDAELAGPGQVIARTAAGALELTGRHLVVATGSVPAGLPGVKIDEERVLSSEGALKLQALPQTLIVVGAGVIGCEWADLMNEFGVKVTVLELLDRILPTEDRATARAAMKILAGRGVNFRLGVRIQELAPRHDGVRCHLEDGLELDADLAVVSVGRRPATAGLGLEPAGVRLERGAIKVDPAGRTAAPGVWAAGDVIGPPMLAHVASHEMEVVVDNILGGGRVFDREVVPAVTFIRPELASVGLSEDRAKAEGAPVEVGRFAYAASGKAQCLGETEGSAKVMVEAGAGRLLGASVMGAHAAELIAELAVAIKARLTVAAFLEIIHAHPTLSEIALEAVADAHGLATHKVGRRRDKTKKGRPDDA